MPPGGKNRGHGAPRGGGASRGGSGAGSRGGGGSQRSGHRAGARSDSQRGGSRSGGHGGAERGGSRSDSQRGAERGGSRAGGHGGEGASGRGGAERGAHGVHRSSADRAKDARARADALPPAPPPPASVRAPLVPNPIIEPTAGRLLWTCRGGFERFLFEELAWAKSSPALIAEGLVESRELRAGTPIPAFARSSFKVDRVARSATETVSAAKSLCGSSQGGVHVQAWSSDTDAGNALSSAVQAVGEAVTTMLGARALTNFDAAAKEERGVLLQLCVVAPELFALGLQKPTDALSPAPGGRHRMWRESRTSRASMKLDEALESLPFAPGRGDLCVDLGAAPGGWTERLLQRGARVIAVDPANMSPDLTGHGKLRHVKASAFTFEPDEPADWLLCDMAWRPLEVAQLLAKWGRRGWSSQLVANIKLPMKDKNPIIHRVRFLLEQHGGWRNVRIRQLYHDRDEVTVTAHKSP